MGELIAVLFVGAIAFLLIKILWPFMLAGAAIWIGHRLYGHYGAQRATQAAERAAREDHLRARADETLKAYNEGDEDAWLYGQHRPAT